MTSTIDSLIRKFTDELRALMREELAAEVSSAIQTALGGGSGKRASSPRSAPRPKGSKRSPEEIEALTKRVYGAIKDNAGSRSEQLANALGLTTAELVLPLKALLSDKKIKSKGVARGTSYTAA